MLEQTKREGAVFGSKLKFAFDIGVNDHSARNALDLSLNYRRTSPRAGGILRNCCHIIHRSDQVQIRCQAFRSVVAGGVQVFRKRPQLRGCRGEKRTERAPARCLKLGNAKIAAEEIVTSDIEIRSC